MGNFDRGALLDAIQIALSDTITDVVEPWEQNDWSQTYEVHFRTISPLFLKGTPRGRPEAQVTAILHRYCPDFTPRVVIQDLLPGSPWCWFLLDHGDCCSHDTLAPHTAVQAAYALGILQRMTCQDTVLQELLPQCRAQYLQRVAVQVCDWATTYATGEAVAQLQDWRVRIMQAKFFGKIAQHLTSIPMTCVHGDFWVGNIATEQNQVCFIDWGNAVWGVGGSAIVNLIETANETLSAWEAEIWGGYSEGWQRRVSPAYIEASAIAHIVTRLVVDMEIAKCCQCAPEMLPDLLLYVQRLVSAMA